MGSQRLKPQSRSLSKCHMTSKKLEKQAEGKLSSALGSLNLYYSCLFSTTFSIGGYLDLFLFMAIIKIAAVNMIE